MFDSGISVKDLVAELITEVDIALDIPNATYVSWLNSLQQTLYTEVIKEQNKITLTAPISNPVSISSNQVDSKENTPRFEDVYTIYADGVQLIKSTLTSGVIFPDTYYKDNNDIGYDKKLTPSILEIVYMVKPSLVEVDENDVIDDSNVMVPVEFIDLVKAKLRGEAYKLANEADFATMWLNDYNVLLETFKVWIAEKAPKFGM